MKASATYYTPGTEVPFQATEHPQRTIIFGNSWEKGLTPLGNRVFDIYYLCSTGHWAPVTREWNEDKKDFDNTQVTFEDVTTFANVFWVEHTVTGKMYRCNQRSRIWSYDRKFQAGDVTKTVKSDDDKLHAAFVAIRKHVNRGKNLHGNSRSEKMVEKYDALKAVNKGTNAWFKHCEKFDLDIDHNGEDLFA